MEWILSLLSWLRSSFIRLTTGLLCYQQLFNIKFDTVHQIAVFYVSWSCYDHNPGVILSFLLFKYLNGTENKCNSQTAAASQKVKNIVGDNRNIALFYCFQNSYKRARPWFLTFYGSLTPLRIWWKLEKNMYTQNLLPMTFGNFVNSLKLDQKFKNF